MARAGDCPGSQSIDRDRHVHGRTRGARKPSAAVRAQSVAVHVRSMAQAAAYQFSGVSLDARGCASGAMTSQEWAQSRSSGDLLRYQLEMETPDT